MWVLIVILVAGNSLAATSAEFTSKEKCEAAAITVKSFGMEGRTPDYVNQYSPNVAYCVEK